MYLPPTSLYVTEPASSTAYPTPNRAKRNESSERPRRSHKRDNILAKAFSIETHVAREICDSELSNEMLPELSPQNIEGRSKSRVNHYDGLERV